MLRKIIISTYFWSIWCFHNYFRKEIASAQKRHFLCCNFRFAKYKVEPSQKYLFWSLPTVLICSGCCQDHFFCFSSFSLFSIFDKETKQKIICLICIFYDQLFLQRKHRYNILVHGGLQKRYNSNNFVSSIFLVFVSQVFPWPLDVGSPFQSFFCEINSSSTLPLCTLTNYAQLSIQSCATQHGRRGGLLSFQNVWFFKSRLFSCENHFMWKFASEQNFLFSRVQNFRLHSATIFPPLLLRDSIKAGRKGNFAQKNVHKLPSESKNADFFILGGRQPPWPSWQGDLSGWAPQTAWKCSWWKPSPCKAGRCHYLRERLKVEKWK